jgi:hypothetical protein
MKVYIVTPSAYKFVVFSSKEEAEKKVAIVNEASDEFDAGSALKLKVVECEIRDEGVPV